MSEALMLIILGIPAVVILTPLLLRSWERRRILDAVMAASNAGQPVPQPVLEALIASTRRADPARLPPPPRHERDHRRGVFLISLGGVFAALGLMLYFILVAAEAGTAASPALALASVGLIPGLMGAAYVLLSKRARPVA